MASCTSTPATRMSQRLPTGAAVLSFRTALVLMRLPFSSWWCWWLAESARCGDRVVEDAEAGADRSSHEGCPAQRCGDAVSPERDGADGPADRQGPAGLEQAPGLAGAEGLRERRPELVLHALEGHELDERTDCRQLARRAVLARGDGDEGETRCGEVGGADEDERQLAVGLVPCRGGRVGKEHRRVGGKRWSEECRPHRGRSVR